jgi:WD40 repeat protein
LGVVVWSASGESRYKLSGYDFGWFAFRPQPSDSYSSRSACPLLSLDGWAKLQAWDGEGKEIDQQETIMRRRRQPSSVRRVPFLAAASSMDGKMLAVASPDGWLGICDLKNNMRIRVLEKSKAENQAGWAADPVFDLGFTPDSKILITANCVIKRESVELSLRFRGAATGKVLGSLSTAGNDASQFSSEWAPRRGLAFAGRLYALLPKSFIQRFAISPDGKHLAVAYMYDGGDFPVCLWDFDKALAKARESK